MKCPKCGFEAGEAKYCPKCGTKIEQESATNSETPIATDNSKQGAPNASQNKFKDAILKVKNRFSKSTWKKIICGVAVAAAIIVVCAVIFHKPNPDKVIITQNAATVGLKESQTISLKVTPVNASGRSFLLVSSNPKVATFTQSEKDGTISAKVNPLSTGSVTFKIDYKSNDGKTHSTNSVKVEVIDKEAQKKQADDVTKRIENLNDVKAENYDEVVKLEVEYEHLPSYAKGLVKNSKKIYDAVKAIDADAKARAVPMDKAIDSIGTVTKDSGNKIKKVRSQFDALPDLVKSKVINTGKLGAAEESFSKIIVQPVISAIDSIGTVTKDSGKKIQAARALYNALSDGSKSSVSNYDKLQSAESNFESIKEEADEAAAKAKEVADYKNSCATYSYKEVARNSDSYSGKNAKFTGQVVQVVSDGSATVLRVSVTKDEYGIWNNDVVYVTYTYPESDSPKILENDIVTMYGTLEGSQTYTSTLGASITIPALEAKYIDIQ